VKMSSILGASRVQSIQRLQISVGFAQCRTSFPQIRQKVVVGGRTLLLRFPSEYVAAVQFEIEVAV
jgi:hypothetical protein